MGMRIGEAANRHAHRHRPCDWDALHRARQRTGSTAGGDPNTIAATPPWLPKTNRRKNTNHRQ